MPKMGEMDHFCAKNQHFLNFLRLKIQHKTAEKGFELAEQQLRLNCLNWRNYGFVLDCNAWRCR